MLVFCYGTLKRGYGNHRILGDSKFIRETKTKPLYKLFHNGSYPCLTKSEEGLAISGEVYEVNEETLSRLDRLEGVPFLYVRDTIQLEDGEALGYIYNRPLTHLDDCGTSWPPK